MKVGDKVKILRQDIFPLKNRKNKNGVIKKSLSASSWIEYTQSTNFNFCEKSIILSQFKSKKENEEFALETWKNTCERKDEVDNLEFV